MAAVDGRRLLPAEGRRAYLTATATVTATPVISNTPGTTLDITANVTSLWEAPVFVAGQLVLMVRSSQSNPRKGSPSV